MKEAKQSLCIILCMILLFVVEGCAYEGRYPFRQNADKIEKVEICQYDSRTQTPTPIVLLSENEGQKLVAELAIMKCKMASPGDRSRYYGLLLICITYSNTEIEMIGLESIGFVDADGKKGLTNYFFDARNLYDLIVKYVDPALLPDVSKEYPSWYWDPTTKTSDPR